MSFYIKYIKRLLDILFSLIVLVLLSPLMLLVALAIKLDSKGPAIIAQERLGRDGIAFRFLKFRSMVIDAENMDNGPFCPKDDPRVTRVGRFIRATSIDELPQFINTLRGDMSVVGFRPMLEYQPWPYHHYNEEQMKMFALRPGITGWAQVNGRRKITFDKRIELSCWYADNVCFWLDVKIFFMTIWVIVRNGDNEDDAVGVVGAPPQSAGEDTHIATYAGGK